MKLRMKLKLKRSPLERLDSDEEVLLKVPIQNAIPIPVGLPRVYEGEMEVSIVGEKTLPRKFSFVVDFNDHKNPTLRVSEAGKSVVETEDVKELATEPSPRVVGAAIFVCSQVSWIKEMLPKVGPEGVLEVDDLIPIPNTIAGMAKEMFRQ